MLGKLGIAHWGWIFLFLDLSAFWAHSAGASGLIGYAKAYRICMITVAGILLSTGALKHPKSIGNLFKGTLGFFSAFAVLAIISASYSSHPAYTAWKGLEMFLLALAMSIFINSRKSWRSVRLAYQMTFVLMSVILMLAWGYAFVFPELGFPEHPGSLGFIMGGMLNSNTLGAFASIVGIHHFVLAFRSGHRTSLHLLLSLISMITVILSYSRTSIIGFFISIFVYAFLERNKILSLFFGAFSIVVIFFGAIKENLFSFLARGQSGGALFGMSGRLNTWRAAIKFWKGSPYIGYGHMSGGRYDLLGNASSHVHGSPFEVLVGLGAIGMIIWLLFILRTILGLYRKQKWKGVKMPNPSREELLAMSTFLVIRGSTSSILAMHSYELMIFACLIGFSMLNPENRLQF